MSDQAAKEFGYELKNPKLVLSRLRSIDFTREEIRNFNLVEYLLSINHDFIKVLLSQLRDSKRFDFIWQFVEQSEMAPIFVKRLHHHWPLIWVIIQGEEVFNAEQKKKYMVYTIYHTNNDDVQIMNTEGIMTRYLSESDDFLDIQEPDIDRIVSVLKLIDVKFQRIVYEDSNKSLFHRVYESHLYELNFEMLSLFIREIYNEKSEKLCKHNNFSIINSKPQEPLYKYVLNNINQYMGVIIDNCDGIISDNEESVLKLLNNPEIENDKKSLYIKYLSTSLTYIRQITEDSLWEELIEEQRIIYSADNILEYYFSYSGMFDNILVDFINSSSEVVDFSFDDIAKCYGETKVNDFIDKLVQCNDLSDERYMMMLRNCSVQYEAFVFSGVQSSKGRYSIDAGVVSMSKDNILFVREHYSEHTLLFITKNIEEYVDLIDDETFLFDELLQVLHSDLISDGHKLKLLGKTTDTISISNETFSDSVTLHILQHNFEVNDFTYIVEHYNSYSEEIKRQINVLTLENIGMIIQEQLEMAFEHFIKILSVDSLETEMKYTLFTTQLPILGKEKTIESLNVLGSEDFLSLFEGKRPKIEITPINEKILDIFQKRHWITQFYEDKNEPEYYRAIGRKFQAKKDELTVDLL